MPSTPKTPKSKKGFADYFSSSSKKSKPEKIHIVQTNGAAEAPTNPVKKHIKEQQKVINTKRQKQLEANAKKQQDAVQAIDTNTAARLERRMQDRHVQKELTLTRQLEVERSMIDRHSQLELKVLNQLEELYVAKQTLSSSGPWMTLKSPGGGAPGSPAMIDGTVGSKTPTGNKTEVDFFRTTIQQSPPRTAPSKSMMTPFWTTDDQTAQAFYKPMDPKDKMTWRKKQEQRLVNEYISPDPLQWTEEFDTPLQILPQKVAGEGGTEAELLILDGSNAEEERQQEPQLADAGYSNNQLALSTTKGTQRVPTASAAMRRTLKDVVNRSMKAPPYHLQYASAPIQHFTGSMRVKMNGSLEELVNDLEWVNGNMEAIRFEEVLEEDKARAAAEAEAEGEKPPPPRFLVIYFTLALTKWHSQSWFDWAHGEIQGLFGNAEFTNAVVSKLNVILSKEAIKRNWSQEKEFDAKMGKEVPKWMIKASTVEFVNLCEREDCTSIKCIGASSKWATCGHMLHRKFVCLQYFKDNKKNEGPKAGEEEEWLKKVDDEVADTSPVWDQMLQVINAGLQQGFFILSFLQHESLLRGVGHLQGQNEGNAFRSGLIVSLRVGIVMTGGCIAAPGDAPQVRSPGTL